MADDDTNHPRKDLEEVAPGLPAWIPLPTDGRVLSAVEVQRLIGAVVGSAVGDALGAPFEFGSRGDYRTRFPEPVPFGRGELIGGGAFNWAPGEFTDDTQMALALGRSLVSRGGFDAADTWTHFRAWHRTARDVGSLTGRALTAPEWPGAARSAHFGRSGRSAANGSLMRVTLLAAAYTPGEEDVLIRAARAQSALTHFDPAAGWGAAIAAALIRRAILGEDLMAAVPEVLGLVDPDHRARFERLLAPDWSPSDPDAPSNGSVWGCLAQALWAVRTTESFHDAVVAAIDLGGDTDTVATVAGALAGAMRSIQGIPSRWTAYVNGSLDLPNGRARFDNAGLQDLARELIGRTPVAPTTLETPAGPVEVAPGLHAADLGGAASVSTEWAVVSLCRTHGRFNGHPRRREVYLIDQEGPANADPRAAVLDAVDAIDAFLDEGVPVVVHCHGGRSRTGLVLKAWAMRTHELDEREAHDWLRRSWPRYEDYQRSFVQLLVEQWP